MTELSARFALPLIQPGQAQKEMFHNEALALVDAVLHPVVDSLATDDPPVAPAPGECWIVGSAPTAAWVGRAGSVAAWTAGGWRFVEPVAGMTAWLVDESLWAWHDGSGWHADSFPAATISIGGDQVLGPQQPSIADPTGGTAADPEARTAIGAILAALRSHGLIAT